MLVRSIIATSVSSAASARLVTQRGKFMSLYSCLVAFKQGFLFFVTWLSCLRIDLTDQHAVLLVV